MRRRPGRRGGAPGPGRGGHRGRAAAGRASAPPRGTPSPRPAAPPRPAPPRTDARVDVAASRPPLELPPLRREFPGLLLNFNFECSSGRCLGFLPVPHFPRPRRPMREQHNSGAAPPPARRLPGRLPAPLPAPGSPLPAPRRPPRLGAALSDRTRPRVRAFRGSRPAAFAGVWGLPPSGALPSGGAASFRAARTRSRFEVGGSRCGAPRACDSPALGSRGRLKSLRKCPKWDLFQNDVVMSMCRFNVASIMCVRRHSF